MQITPKNWASFQHYKNRSPVWIKLHRDLLNDFAFSRLPVASRALAPLLWLLASEYEGGKINASTEELAFRLHMTEREFGSAVKPLLDSGFFIDEQNASVSLAPRKQDAHLEEKRREQEREEKSLVRERFEELKKSYPKRKGGQGFSVAERIFEKETRDGIDPLIIIDAAKQFAQVESEKVGTEFIPMMETWMRKRMWLEFKPSDPEKMARLDRDMAERGYVWADGKWTPKDQVAA